MITFQPTPKQHQAWLKLTDKITNEILFGGGAGGGKTTVACAWLLISSQIYPGTRYLIGRKELKRLKQSSLMTLFDLFSDWGFVSKKHYSYNSTDSNIQFDNRSEFHLMDLDRLPSDPNYERLGSIEYTAAFIEEAAEVEQKAKDVVRSRIRYKLKEYNLIPKLLMTCNPSKNWLYNEYYQPWKKGVLSSDKAFIRALVTDNPHISPFYIQSLKGLKDRILRERLLLGNWEYADDDNALFTFDALNDLFTNTLNQEDDKVEKYISCDAARFGIDKAVIMLWYGFKVVKIWEYDKTKTTEIENHLITIAVRERVPISHIVVDEDGVGGGIVDHLKCKGFVGNASPIENKKPSEMRQVEYKINYQNLRAQCYYTFADMVNSHDIRIETDSLTIQDTIIHECEQIKAADINRDVKFKIVSKEDIKAALGHSPDYADTLMMRMYFVVKPELKKARAFANNPL